MRRILNKLLRDFWTTGTPRCDRRARRPQSARPGVKPQLECLEKREVLSTSSASLHAVTDVFGNNMADFLQSTAGQAPQLIASTNRLDNGGR
jgi:hypothetical protein